MAGRTAESDAQQQGALAMSDHAQHLDFRLVTEQSDLYSIVDDWRQLLAETANRETMLDPSWLLGWWREYGAGVELAVGQLFDGEKLVGFAPLCIRRYSYCPGLTFRRLQFMGVDADDTDGVCSMYLGFLAARGYETDVAQAFIDNIVAGQFGNAHEIMLGPMRSAGQDCALTRQLLERHGLRCEDKRTMTNYYVTLPKTWDDYLSALPSSCRSFITGKMADFEHWANEQGGWTLEHATSSADLEEAFDTLVGLRLERLSPRFLAFQKQYLASEGSRGQIEIATLKVNGSPVAGVYTMQSGKSVFAYQYGWAAVPGLDIGLVLNAFVIQRAIGRGDETFDFLTGGFGFEADFATARRPVSSLRATRRSWREAIRLSLLDGRDAARAVAKAGRSLAKNRAPDRFGIPLHADAAFDDLRDR